MREWIPLLGSGAFGAILTKAVDAFYLQRALQNADRRRWLREKRLRAYSKLIAELLSLGRNSDLRNDAFEGYALAADSILLTDDDELASEIESFFTALSNLFKEAAKPLSDPTRRPEEEINDAYGIVFETSRRLVTRIRRALRDT